MCNSILAGTSKKINTIVSYASRFIQIKLILRTIFYIISIVYNIKVLINFNLGVQQKSTPNFKCL